MKINLEEFTKEYIETWCTTNSKERKNLVNKLYSASTIFFANEPGDSPVEYYGTENVYKNITQVNERLVIENKLITESTGYSENHNTLRVTWQMKTLNGDIALKGMNFLIIDKFGKIERDFIFIN